MTEKYPIKSFEIFLSPEKSVIVRAHRTDYGSNMLYLQMVKDNGNHTWTYECVASFPFENICGWMELDLGEN
jgi:hypothetical protein